MADVEAACLRDWRRELVGDLAGDVCEIGAGTGLNLPHYAPGVGRLVLTEPDPHMRTRLIERAASLGREVEVAPADAEALPFPEASFDAVVSTLVLCSVRDPRKAIAEIRRVLRPGGRLAFVEHVASDDPRRLWWQRTAEPVWKWCAGGCHLTRNTGDLLAEAGFDMSHTKKESLRKAMPLVRPSIRGVVT